MYVFCTSKESSAIKESKVPSPMDAVLENEVLVNSFLVFLNIPGVLCMSTVSTFIASVAEQYQFKRTCTEVGDGELKTDDNTWKQCYLYQVAKQKWFDTHTKFEPDRNNPALTNARCAFEWCRKLFKNKKFEQEHLDLKHSPNETIYAEPQQPRELDKACSFTGRVYGRACFEIPMRERAMLTKLATELAVELMESVVAEMITDILVSDECKGARKRAKETHALQQLNSSFGVKG